MIAKYKRVLSSTPTIMRQLLGPRQMTLRVVRFINSTRVGRSSRQRELEKKAEQRDKT